MNRITRFSVPLVLLLLALGALGCPREEPHGRSDGGVTPGADGSVPVTGSLRIDPADHEVVVTGGASQAIEYHAFYRDASGAERDVTSETTWSSTLPGLGTFSGSVFSTTPDRGGVTRITAHYAGTGASTSTQLTVRVERIVIAGGASADTPARFDGDAGAGAGPEVVYPNDGTLVPPNLQRLEIHFREAGAEAFELRLEAPSVSLRIFMGCPERVSGGCIYTFDRDTWDTLSTASAGLDPITYRLRGVNAAGAITESAPRTLAIVREPITGGLYYWNAGDGTIDRFEFGVPGARAEVFLDKGRAGAGTCVGCHAVSRDGTRISIGTDMPTTTFQVFDVATRTRQFQLTGSGSFFPEQPNFATFSPDAAQIATSYLTGLTIRDATTGVVIEDRVGGGPAAHPEWSPDGDHIVFVQHEAPPIALLKDVMGVTSGRIAILDRAGAGWSSPRTIVATPGQNNYYPAYAPDGRFVSFCRSPSNIGSAGGEQADDGSSGAVADAELWLIPADGSGEARRLSSITGLADSWPKWDPTEYQNHDRPLYWMSWTSRRAYGLRTAADANAQIWMAAFDPAAADRGEEGFSPAFWLPFQNIATGNHVPYWVTRVERQTCTTNADCGGEFCVDGRCFETEPLY